MQNLFSGEISPVKRSISLDPGSVHSSVSVSLTSVLDVALQHFLWKDTYGRLAASVPSFRRLHRLETKHSCSAPCTSRAAYP